MHIDVLDLSVRSRCALLHAGIETVEQLKCMSQDDFNNVQNLNLKCEKEIRRKLYYIYWMEDVQKTITKQAGTIEWNQLLREQDFVKNMIMNYAVAVLAEVAERARQEDTPIYEEDQEVDQWIRLSDVNEAINKVFHDYSKRRDA